MARLIGTAGHVDHGKTTLIKALTGIDADRLPEEKARGMTIDVGFAYVDLPEIGRVSIVDVPGHERFLSNMLVGALGIDVALLCVAADEGVKPQTLEHFQILELLPVQKLVVAMTRSDLADAETMELAKLEVAELLSGTRFQDSPTVAVSAVSGAGTDELRSELAKSLAEADTARPRGLWYLPVDRVFTVKGHGCVVTGTLARGTVKVGDAGVLSPGGKEVRIRAIHSHDEELSSIEPGRRTALNLGNMKAEEIHRGQTVASPGAVFETLCLDAEVRWVNECRHAERVRISVGSAEVIGKIFLDASEKRHVQLRTMEPVAVALDQPIVVRKHSPPLLLCGGKVTVPLAKPRQKAVKATGASVPDQILEVVGTAPQGLETAEVCRQLGRTPQELGNEFESLAKAGKIIGFAGLWFNQIGWTAVERKLIEALQGLHDRNPTTPWHARDAVVKEAGFRWSGKPLDRIVTHLASQEKLDAQGTGIKLPGFKVQLTDRQRTFLDRVKEELERQEVSTPNSHELSRLLNVPIQAVEEILKVGQLAGEVVNLEGGVHYTVHQIEGIKERLRREYGDKRFGAGEIRDALGASRKYVIPLLEHLDKLGFTLRTGDQRAIRKPSEP